MPKQDTELLEAALIGFMHQRDEVQRKIDELRDRIGEPSASISGGTTAGGTTGRRSLSPAARHRIALAQKKRWAAYKAKNGSATASKPKKRVLSAAGRARIVAATKKRWAAFRKEQEAKKSS
ncbi:MAG: hypothetical protein ABSH50_21290 [Bryobacteraceae bacterium]|jgi:hypothetical protein